MRITVLLVVAAACGSGRSQHDLVDCSVAAQGGEFKTCERACVAPKTEVKPFNGCNAVNPYGATASHGDTSMWCPRESVKSYGGVTGCCAFDGDPADDGAVMRFFQCDSDL